MYSITGAGSTSLGTLLGIRKVRETLSLHFIREGSNAAIDRLDKAMGFLASAADSLRHLSVFRIKATLEALGKMANSDLRSMARTVADGCTAHVCIEPPPGFGLSRDRIADSQTVELSAEADSNRGVQPVRTDADVERFNIASPASACCAAEEDGVSERDRVAAPSSPLLSSSGGDSVRSGAYGGSWHSSDDGDRSHGAADEWNQEVLRHWNPELPHHASAESEAGSEYSLSGLIEERNLWLDRYWYMGEPGPQLREFRRKLLQQAQIEYPQLRDVELPSCFQLDEEPDVGASSAAAADCKQQ